MLSAQLADEISKQIKGIEPKKYIDNQGQLVYQVPVLVEIKSLGELCNGSEPIFIFVCGVKEIKFRDNTRLEPFGCTGLYIHYSPAAARKREADKKAAIEEQALFEKNRIAAKRKTLIAEEVSRLAEEEKTEAGIFEGQVNEDQKISLEKQAEQRLIEQGVIK